MRELLCTALRIAFVAAALVVLPSGGCTITVDPPPPPGDGGGGNGDPPTTITVRIFNLTGATLDPEIYFTDAAVTDPAQLFVPERKYTRFGVGTRGLLGDFDSAEFPLDCTAVRVIGTRGGVFGDDLDNPEGRGQQRIFTQDTNFSCGDTLTFSYGRDGNTFTTSVAVSR